MIDFFEKNLEDIIFDNRDIIHNRGFLKMHPVNFRQFRLPSGKKIDILSCYSRINVFKVNIIELKRDVIDDDALIQAMRYASELLTCLRFGRTTIEITIVGSRVSKLTVHELIDKSITVKAFTYAYQFDGIKFNEVDTFVSGEANELDYFRSAVSAAQYGIIPENNNITLAYKASLISNQNTSSILGICQSLNKPKLECMAIINSISNNHFSDVTE